jgi:deglycase
MSGSIHGKRVAILIANGVEQVELTEPRIALELAGARTEIVSPVKGRIQAMNHDEKGDTFKADIALSSANPQAYDALLLPGGVANPDYLRLEPDAVAFVKSFFDEHKPVASICHGPWMLVEADVVRGHTLTSWPSLKTDIRNAGGTWVDRVVVRDGNLTTSRKPADLPAFIDAMLDSFARGPIDLHARQAPEKSAHL